MGSGTARYRACLIARLDTGIVSQPAHTAIASDAPEAVIDPLERAHQRRSRRHGASMETPYGEVMPPRIGLGKRADSSTGKATAPMIVDIRAQLVAGEPIDLIFFDS